MKALSVKQPFATLVAEGVKTIEVRSWSTAHRGPLLICASKAPKDFFWLDPVDKVHRLMHAGCMIGVVDLVDCRLMRKSDAKAAFVPFEDGAYAWVLRPMTYVRPDPISGRLNLFEVDDARAVPIANDESDWIFNYPCPQGDIGFKKTSPWFSV